MSSVRDYFNEFDLRKALLSPTTLKNAEKVPIDDTASTSVTDISDYSNRSDLEWTVPADNASSEPQTVEQEMRRLLCLKSYLVHENPAREAFAAIASIAKSVVGGSWSLVTIIDLGQLWYLANSEGPTGLSSLGRKTGVCPHALLSRGSLFCIPNMLEDSRFCQAPFVTEAPHLRFYAGVPLVVPEGYKIGVLCVMDNKPHAGLSRHERETLLSLAQLAVATLVQHKAAAEQKDVAVQPLNGLRLSLELLEEEGVLSGTQQECLRTARDCVEKLREGCPDGTEKPPVVEMTCAVTGHISVVPRTSTHLPSLVDRLYAIVPCVADLTTAPPVVPLAELIVLRAALGLLSQGASSPVRLVFSVASSSLVIECSYAEKEDSVSQQSDSDSVMEDSGAVEAVCCYRRPCGHDAIGRSTDWEALQHEVKSVGGSSGVASTSSEPVRYWVSLPMTTTPSACPIEADNADDEDVVPRNSPQKSALVIDDSAVVRKVLSRSLHSLGYRVAVAVNGERGLEKLKKKFHERPYDLVLCDFDMPQLNGLDCLQEFRHWEQEQKSVNNRNDICQKQFIVGMASSKHDPRIDEGYKRGMNAFRSKPLTMKALRTLEFER